MAMGTLSNGMDTLEGFHRFLDRYEALKTSKSVGTDQFVTEFQQIKQESFRLANDGKYPANEGSRELNRKKNRYKDILPFDTCRVILPKVNDQDGSDYINASYIKAPNGKKGYIASQGPMPQTVDDFWRMIWHHRIKVIVMACREIELGKHRCQRYWAERGEDLAFHFGEIEVKLVNQKSLGDNLYQRILLVTRKSEELRLTQIHYTAWPDHGAPNSSKSIMTLIKAMRDIQSGDDPPLLIHCSAGCGRTGAIIAIDYCRRLIKDKKSNLDLYEIITNLRKQRPAMVQTKEQYEYVHDVVHDLILEELRQQKPEVVHSYVNVDIGQSEDAPLYENVGPHINHSPNTRRKKMYGSSTCLDQMETDEKPESHLKRAHSLMGRHRQERRPKIDVPELPKKTPKISRPVSLEAPTATTVNTSTLPSPTKVKPPLPKRPGDEPPNYVNVNIDASKNQIRRPRAASPKPTLPNNTSSDMLKQKNKARSYENLVEDSDQPSLNDKTSKQLKNEYANTDLKSKPSENKSSEVFASDPKPTLPVKPARKTPHGAKTVPSEPLDNWTPTKPQQVNNYENAFPNNPPPKPKRRMGSPVDTTDSIDLVDSPIPLLETDILQPQKADYEPSEAEKPEENCNLVRSSPHVKPALKKTFSSEKQLLVKKDSSSSNSSFPLPTDSNFHNSNSRDQKVSVGKLIDFDDDDDDLNSEVAENVDNAYGVVWKESKEVTSRPDNLYASVNKPSADKGGTSESTYEEIWPRQKKRRQPSPRAVDDDNDDVPPPLPERTMDSFVIQKAPEDEAKRKSDPSLSDPSQHLSLPDESPVSPVAAVEQWLSGGLKKLNIKAPFHAAGKVPRPSASSPDKSSTKALGYGQRLAERPKGPRPQPKKWPKYSKKT